MDNNVPKLIRSEVLLIQLASTWGNNKGLLVRNEPKLIMNALLLVSNRAFIIHSDAGLISSVLLRVINGELVVSNEALSFHFKVLSIKKNRMLTRFPLFNFLFPTRGCPFGQTERHPCQ